ncbi:MAG: hypothetical protein ABIR71_03690 [Chthoniobacterales bacterium]
MSASSVLFLAPGIRPGSGGVADYCVHLSAALTKTGVGCHLASWNETKGDDNRARVLYLHENSESTSRTKAATLRAYLERHQIQWVSLQFVNFGFAERGLIYGLASALAGAFQGRRCHLFLHELWLGAHRGARLRERLLGSFQKRQLLHLLETLRPAAVWTSNDLYQKQLAREGVETEVLPIFGNIPISTLRLDDFILRQLEVSQPARKREDYFLVGLFGTINRAWPFRDVIPRLLPCAGQRRVAFILFGRSGEADAFREYVAGLRGVQVLSLGPLEVETIDQVINSMDVALTSTPAEGIFKSGSAVAFLERGVPTIAVHRGLDDLVPPAESAHPSLLLADDKLERNLAKAATTRRSESFQPAVVQRYLELFRT